MFETKVLFASLIWSSVGIGCFIYGKKQGSPGPLVGGILMIGASYLVDSAPVMSLLCSGIALGIYLLSKRQN